MAACPQDCPITLRLLANDPGVVWGFDADDQGSPANLNGSVFDLVVAWPAYRDTAGTLVPAGRIDHSSGMAASSVSSGDGVLTVDLATADVTWPVTVAETQAVPRMPGKVSYVLFRTIAGQDGKPHRSEWCGGAVTVQTWLPLDLPGVAA